MLVNCKCVGFVGFPFVFVAFVVVVVVVCVSVVSTRTRSVDRGCMCL